MTSSSQAWKRPKSPSAGARSLISHLQPGQKIVPAQGLYGRIAAYEAGLSSPAAGLEVGLEVGLEAALRRNLFGTVTPEPEQVRAMAAYLRGAVDVLTRWEPAKIEAAGPEFGPPPGASDTRPAAG